MRLNLEFERLYPHPIERVWNALIRAEALAEWLMEGNFEPVVGREFQLRFCPEDESDTEEQLVFCKVLEIVEPTRMVWEWRNEGEKDPTTVVFELTPQAGGTRFVLRHIGEVSDDLGSRLTDGWPKKLDALGAAIQ